MKLTNSQKVKLFNALGTAWAEILPVPVIKRILRLSSASDLAKRTNKALTSITYHIKCGHVPGPSVKINKRWFWTAADARMVEDYLSVRRYTPRRSRYTELEMAEMKRLWSLGVSQWDIARKFDATQSLVSRIVNGKKYNSKPVE
jgi:hypothetical protein